MFKKNKVLIIGSDHGGYKLKEFLKEKLIKKGYKLKDYGTYSEKSIDYPDIIHPLSKSINNSEHEIGIIICGSGNGAQMTANKYPNVRAALCWNVEQAKLSRLHNDANIISLPGRFIDEETAFKMVEIFLNTEFEGGRHKKRVEKISKII
ncbi:MAG: ribose 5-phosphate isomerase B [Bacteroidales bacterium]|nr:ribose 5-phosphate isomerase B [Bacteroidales bacterium]